MQTLRFDPFRDFDRLAADLFGTARTPSPMPMDCLRSGEQFVVRFDLPGIDVDSLEVSAENQTLTVRAERTRRQRVRPGLFTFRGNRQSRHDYSQSGLRGVPGNRCDLHLSCRASRSGTERRQHRARFCAASGGCGLQV